MGEWKKDDIRMKTESMSSELEQVTGSCKYGSGL
jgi:hypothetical protein